MTKEAMKKKVDKTAVRDYLRCSYPAIAVETFEEARFVRSIVDLTKNPSFADLNIFTLSTQEIKVLKLAEGVQAPPAGTLYTWASAFAFAAAQKNRILIVYDFQHVVNSAVAYRPLKDQLNRLKSSGSCVILVAPSWKLPPELSHDVPVETFALPTRQQLNAALDVVIKSSSLPEMSAIERAACLDGASGLSNWEAEQIMALSVAKTKEVIPELVAAEKMKAVKAGGLLEIRTPPDFDPGGLGELRGYLQREVVDVYASVDENFTPELMPKGILLMGVPGVGKTMVAYFIARLLGWPLVRMDFAGLKNSLVGQSEQNLRRALAQVDAVAPCVLVIDEIEKGTAGHGGSNDSVTSPMVGTLLTWLQDRLSRVYVVATCNDDTKLPPELMRAGRIDDRFFLDLPSAEEREEIAEVHLNRFNKGPQDGLAEYMVPLTPAWTGAEIEQLVKSAARRTKCKITKESLFEAASVIRPLSQTRATEIDALRTRAAATFRAANTVVREEVGEGRKMRA